MNRYIVTLLFLLPFTASAQVSFSEIMYDLEGSDAGREWVELRNDGDTAVDLSIWRLFEAQTNHKLTLFAGEQSVPPGGYAVIADDAEKFLNDWPGFAGALFDSSFSFGNSGETLVLRDGELRDVDTVSYLPEWGAGGDGRSLHKSAGGAWSASPPSPGMATASPVGAIASPVVPETAPDPSYTPEPQQKIRADAGPARRTAVVGGGIVFKGAVYGLRGEPVSNAHFSWSFGDGGMGEGLSVSHTYRYTGEYVVILEGSSAGYSASDRVDVVVVPSDIGIGGIGTPDDFFVSVENGTEYEIDLFGWILASGEERFTIPRNTTILPGKRLAFSSAATELSAHKDVSLLYPDGTVASVYKESGFSKDDPGPSGVSEEKISAPLASDTAAFGSGNRRNGASGFADVLTEEATPSLASPAGQGVVSEQMAGADALPSVMPWLLALGVFLSVSSASIFFIRGKRSPADQFKIIEEK